MITPLHYPDLKYKLAHKRADKDNWSATPKTQRKHLITFFKEMIKLMDQQGIPLELEYKGKKYKGEALPIPDACHDEVCDQLDIILNNEHLGIIRNSVSGWKMKYVTDQKLVDAIGQKILLWYE